MSRALIDTQASDIDALALDSLIGSYAALGAADIRRRRCRRALWLAGMAAGLAVIAVVRPHWVFPFYRDAELAEFRTRITARIEDGLDTIGRESAALQSQRERIDGQLGELGARLTEFELQARRWEARQAELLAQSEALRGAMQELESERANLVGELERRLTSGRELADIAATREALDTQLADFIAGETAIDGELEALRQQRQTVENQREVLERQKAELEAALYGETDSDRTARGTDDGDSPLPSQDSDSDQAYGLLLFAGREDSLLAESRAGVRLGDGMNVSLGLTRTASVNGVDQLIESVDLGSVGSGISLSGLGGMNGFVIQNGPGNYIGSAALDAVGAGYGSVLQNSLDDQLIRTETIYDVRIEDVANAVRGLAAEQALEQSLQWQP